MKRWHYYGLAVGGALAIGASGAVMAQAPADDAAYAGTIWEQLVSQRLVGPDALGAVPYAREGQAHGATLVTFQSVITVDGVTGPVLIKRSYTDAATRGGIIAHPNENLENVTVMFQREDGYDAANQDWFWAMYAPTGMVGQMDGMNMAGQVTMCSGCHATAPGNDYIFLHDGMGGM
ncbi:MAG: cytochrome P460 family protein [Bauldia sp.]